jgi:hypothetical protein
MHLVYSMQLTGSTTVIQIRITEPIGLGGHKECLLVGDEGDRDDVDFLLDLETILYPGSVDCAANLHHYRGNFTLKKMFQKL